MKNVLCTAVVFLLSVGWANAQLVNDGATIIVKSGAKLIVETDVSNSNGGTINVEGELEVQGDLTNAATSTFTTTSASLVKFSGAGNSVIEMNGDAIKNMSIVKDAASNTVTLNGDLSIDEDLAMTTGLLVLGNSDVLLTAGTTTASGSSNGYAVTDMGGVMTRAVSASNEAFTFHVGEGGYTPIATDVTGSTLAVGSMLSASSNDQAQGNLPVDADSYINRHWVVTADAITDYTNAVTGTYLAGDVEGGSTATNIKGASYDGTDWSYADAAGSGLTVSGTIEADMAEFTGSNFFGAVDLTVFLQGAFSGGSMTTTLNTAGLIPLTSPYAADAVTATAIPAGVTDWILLEVRDASNPATVVSSHSAFLMSDGTIKSYADATKLPGLKDAAATGFIAVKHRNHLPIRTPSVLNFASPTAYNTSTGIAQVYTDAAIANAAMKNQSGTFCMWSGNANGNEKLQYNGGGLNDRLAMLLKVGFTTPSTPTAGYFPEDVNLDGVVQYNGGGLNDRLVLLLNVGFTTPSTPLNAHL